MTDQPTKYSYTVADLIEDLERFDDDMQVRFGRYEIYKGYYRIERLDASEMFVRPYNSDGGLQSCDESESEEASPDGRAVRMVVIT